jgi:hypothetical protein
MVRGSFCYRCLLTTALPQPQGQAQRQAQGNVTALSDKGLIQALEGNYSGALSLYKKAFRSLSQLQQGPEIGSVYLLHAG